MGVLATQSKDPDGSDELRQAYMDLNNAIVEIDFLKLEVVRLQEELDECLQGLQGVAPQWALKDVDVGLPVSGVKERLPNLMEAYREEVLNGHVLTTAAKFVLFHDARIPKAFRHREDPSRDLAC